MCVSHAYVHLVDFGTPVTIGGLTVNSGDIMHGDKHGVMVVPAEAASEITSAAARVAERERRIMDCCAEPDFSLERLKAIYESKDATEILTRVEGFFEARLATQAVTAT